MLNLIYKQQPIYCTTLQLCSSTGTDYNFTGIYNTAPSPISPSIKVSFSGTAVCSTKEQIIFSIDTNSCTQYGAPGPSFCPDLGLYYAGKYDYGIAVFNGRTVMNIESWAGSSYPLELVCTDTSCGTSIACNNTVIAVSELNLYGSSLVLNSTNAGPTYVTLEGNSTSVFYGDRVTLENNNNVTLVMPNVTDVTISSGPMTTNNITITSPPSVYNFNVSAPASCNNFADLKGESAANLTVNTAGLTRVLFDGGSQLFTRADWVLSDANTLNYTGLVSGSSWVITYCLQGGKLYNPSSVGQRVLLQLWNVTAVPFSAVDANSFSYSPLISNLTNPAFIGSSCATIITDEVYTGNLFGLYAMLQHTDASPGASLLGAATSYSISFAPTGCAGSVTNIHINATFANTSLEVGTCLDETFPDSKTLRIDNPGVCTARVNSNTPFGGSVAFVDSQTVFFSQSGNNVTATVDTYTINPQQCILGSIANYLIDVGFNGVCGLSIAGNPGFAVTAAPGGTWTLTFTGMSSLTLPSGAVLNGVVVLQNSSSIGIAPGTGGSNTIEFFYKGTSVEACGLTCSNNTVQSMNVVNETVRNIQCNPDGSPTKVCSLSVQPPSTPTAPGPDSSGRNPWNFCNGIVGKCTWHIDGGGGGGGGDGAGGYPPPVPIVPFPPFFPPIIPIVPGIPGGGAGGSTVPTSSPPLGTPPLNVTGGLFVPMVNFSTGQPICFNETGSSPLGSLIVVDNSTLPNQPYICLQLNETVWAWVPLAIGSPDYQINMTGYITNTTLQLNNASLVLDAGSQFIQEGNTYLGGNVTYINSTDGANITAPVYLYGPTVVEPGGSLDVCPSAQPLTAPLFSGCTGQPAYLNSRSTTVGMQVGGVTLFYCVLGGACHSAIPLDVCGSQITASSFSGCSGAPASFPNGIAGATSSDPAVFPNGATFTGGAVTLVSTTSLSLIWTGYRSDGVTLCSPQSQTGSFTLTFQSIGTLRWMTSSNNAYSWQTTDAACYTVVPNILSLGPYFLPSSYRPAQSLFLNKYVSVAAAPFLTQFSLDASTGVMTFQNSNLGTPLATGAYLLNSLLAGFTYA